MHMSRLKNIPLHSANHPATTARHVHGLGRRFIRGLGMEVVQCGPGAKPQYLALQTAVSYSDRRHNGLKGVRLNTTNPLDLLCVTFGYVKLAHFRDDLRFGGVS